MIGFIIDIDKNLGLKTKDLMFGNMTLSLITTQIFLYQYTVLGLLISTDQKRKELLQLNTYIGIFTLDYFECILYHIITFCDGKILYIVT